MSESTLSYDYVRLQREIGREIGYGRDPAAWTGANAYKLVDVNDSISAGLLRFYRSHAWEFLNPVIEVPLYARYTTGTITVVNGVVTLSGGTFPAWAAAGELVCGELYSIASRDGNTQLTLNDTTINIAASTSYVLSQLNYELPDDFGGFTTKKLHFRASDQTTTMDVWLTSNDTIDDYRRVFDYSDYTLRASTIVRPRSAATTGTRYNLRLWPGPMAAGRLIGRARVHPNMLTGTDPLKYPYGGMLHGPAIDAACKHEACMRFKEAYDGRYLGEFKDFLKESKTRDAEAFSPKTLGFELGTGPTYDPDAVLAMTIPYGVPYVPFADE